SAKSCTITNEEKPTHLTVSKVVVNHGQSKVASDFGLCNVDGSPVELYASTLENSGSHTVTENSSADYTTTYSANCPAGVVTLVKIGRASCRERDTEKPASLVIHKVVVNHGLSNDASHFAPYKANSTTLVLDAVT